MKNVSIQYLNIVTIVFGWTQNVQDIKGTQFTYSIYSIKWTNQNHCFQNVHQKKLRKFVFKWINIWKASNKKLHSSLIKSKLFLINAKILKTKLYSKIDRVPKKNYFLKARIKWKNSQTILLDKKSKELSKKSNLIESIFYSYKNKHQFL